ncbi:DUF501 domain-containing protein [Coprothermobacter platensis]|uniref:DUF501 domain-containing protein n=1 Tax=Coprothermobacter platensis TaxID=108819 RepID=UPI000A077078|nr:DUF501 domain-containing protein [Coprothermobacter platensis]
MLTVPRSLDSVIRCQLGRKPRGTWFPRVFCPYGYPMVLETEPFFEDGTPFPTVFWLTCPFLREQVSKIESGSIKHIIINGINVDEHARKEELNSELAFSTYLQAKGFSEQVFIGGSKKPMTFKCLHALMAWYLVSHKGSSGQYIINVIGNTYCESIVCEVAYDNDK